MYRPVPLVRHRPERGQWRRSEIAHAPGSGSARRRTRCPDAPPSAGHNRDSSTGAVQRERDSASRMEHGTAPGLTRKTGSRAFACRTFASKPTRSAAVRTCGTPEYLHVLLSPNRAWRSLNPVCQQVGDHAAVVKDEFIRTQQPGREHPFGQRDEGNPAFSVEVDEQLALG